MVKKTLQFHENMLFVVRLGLGEQLIAWTVAEKFINLVQQMLGTLLKRESQDVGVIQLTRVIHGLGRVEGNGATLCNAYCIHIQSIKTRRASGW